MALINCGECDKEVSDKAISCPNCGAPISSESKKKPKRVKTAEDSALTRNRGLGDILLFGPIILLILFILF